MSFRPMLALLALAALTGCATLAGLTGVPEDRRVLFWSHAKRAEAFPAMERYATTDTVAAGTERALPRGEPLALELDLARHMREHDMAGIIVLRDGAIVLEAYGEGFGPEQRWSTFSVAKSVTSLLVGAALADGAIPSLDAPITDHLPELADTAYAGVSLRDVLTMSSGVQWSESYRNPFSDVARFAGFTSDDGLPDTLGYMQRLSDRDADQGFNYSTGETNLAGLVVERAVGMPLADYLSDALWQPLGMEADGIWAVDTTGHAYGGCCLSARLRDWARLGQFVLDGGIGPDGEVLVDPGYLAEATRAQVALGNGYGYGYQWWIHPGGAYGARGIFGQSIDIDPGLGMVVVMLRNTKKATSGRDDREARQAVLRAIVSATRG